MPLRGQDLLTFLKISRAQNIGIALASLAIAAWLATRGSLSPFLTSWFWIEAGVLSLLMAGGFWVNDVYDHKIDQINKPKKALVGTRISTKKVMTGYFLITMAALGLSLLLLPLRLTVINLLGAFLLYLYSQFFKRTSVIGNLIIALLTSLVVLAGAMIEPQGYRLAVVWAGIFAFWVTFLREVTKDIEDLKGDMHYRLQTLPIQIGIRRTKWVLAAGFVLFLLACQLPWFIHYLLWDQWAVQYIYVSFFLVQIPMGINLYFLHTASRPKDFHRPSQVLKLVIITGIISLFFIP